MKVVQHTFKLLISVHVIFLIGIFFSGNVLADVPKLLAQGDQNRLMGDHSLAEKAYTEALVKEPKNYRILKSLVEVKVELGKYAEAKPLAEKILSRKDYDAKKSEGFLW